MSRHSPLPDVPPLGHQFATFGGGCFWCTEAVFQEVQGVLDVESGYAGGHTPSPSYYQVSQGQTGHAEVIRLAFDPSLITYRELLEIFFVVHDPTTLNRQGNDVGEQYRSVIFYHDANQEKIAQEVIAELQLNLTAPVVTQLVPVANYYRAEQEHQEYFATHRHQGYCMAVIAPKVEKFRQTFLRKQKAN